MKTVYTGAESRICCSLPVAISNKQIEAKMCLKVDYSHYFSQLNFAPNLPKT